ncbi:MEKHLA domain-containing protein [Alteraurantiacibacter aquimixticola]|uniref:MEKHLA domain-containing protein n=1 Tax=Alteraurantiacibacter aquimixticola TaxID=2489173 RepID=A0A4T3F0C2_9SPHN|nr:MEKHLA domain-containing protein [Alteraurantiacibacter aquimixticola]TIX50479.1 MEKHLA domain-containing protein [Alteraurantiacibacter aquimixticola]
MDDREAMERSAGARLALLEESFAHLAGRPLVAGGDGLWNAPGAVVAHGTQDPPLFFYGNRTALTLFRMSAEQFIGLPSYKSAEPGLRAERAAMLAKLDAEDVVTGYHGIRIAADGTRFRIEDAVIWNLVDATGKRHGQAATFGKWEMVG